ncbi:MAG: Transcriptional regulator MntR [Firmicutes bacterium]|nr:Transcriptional regulator MntR [candidate division NPL-UPA2 bacterium]MBT9154066.1 Transcriptional regulator MntR [candidate division NPL-UPA2 bacterium]
MVKGEKHSANGGEPSPAPSGVPNGLISLTDAGRDAGEFLLDRHNSVDLFLRLLGVEQSRFVETELIEHHVGAYTLVLIKQWVEFLRHHPDVLGRFQEFAEKCRQFN